MDVESVLEKLNRKNEIAKEDSIRSSAIAEENRYEAKGRFELELEETIQDFEFFMDSDEFMQISDLFVAMEGYESFHAESISSTLIKRVKKENEKHHKEQERLARLLQDAESESERKKLKKKLDLLLNNYIFPEEETIKYLQSLGPTIVIYRDGDGCELTGRGFKRQFRLNGSVSMLLNPEEVVRGFSKFVDESSEDWQARWPSRLIPYIKSEFEKRVALANKV